VSFNPFSDLPLKIGAVALAFLLWVHVATNKSYEHVFEIPLKLVDIPSGLILTSTPPQFLSVQVRATGKQLFGIMTSDKVYHLDLADFKAGNHKIDLTSAQMLEILSGGYQDVELLSPQEIKITLEREVTRELPVVANLDVATAEGYVVMGKLDVNPPKVSVTGPESVMGKLHEIGTESQSIVGVVESFDAELALQLPDSLHLSTRDSTVDVSIKVEPRDNRTFDNVAVKLPRRFNSKHYVFSPESLKVVLGIPRSLVDSVGIDNISVSFEGPFPAKDSAKVPLLYDLPDRVELIQSSADSVLIKRKS
jgi:YbbR domain-containing protein